MPVNEREHREEECNIKTSAGSFGAGGKDVLVLQRLTQPEEKWDNGTDGLWKSGSSRAPRGVGWGGGGLRGEIINVIIDEIV